LSKGLQTFADLGYVGIQKDFPQYQVILPHKKKKNKSLSILQKRFNKEQSKIRIRVEHAICHVKKFRILSHTFRNKLSRYDTISEIVCGLINSKIKFKEKFTVTS